MRKEHWAVKLIVIGVVVILTGWTADAAAGRGRGGRGAGPTYSADLTDAQISQLAAERQSFMESTKDIREQLREKNMLLHAEQAKKSPDTAKISSLESELTTLRAQFQDARQQHVAAMKRIDPNFTEGKGGGRGCGAGMGAGYGNGSGCGYGRGYSMNN